MKQKEFKSFQLKLEDVSTQGMIRGYASTFGNIDLGDDVVEKGAFKKTIKETKGIIPILDSHDGNRQIGWNLRAQEDDKGLFVEGELVLESPEARQKYELAKKAVSIGAKMGLSIGYYTIKAEPDRERPAVRRLKELRLFEYSLVTFPMNTQAAITDIKKESIEDSVNTILNTTSNFGFGVDEVDEALRNGAANNKSDPILNQLLDDMLKLFKKGE